jgi:phage shock protein A
MDWTRISRLLNTPVDKLMARLKRHEKRLSEWEVRMDAQTKELESLTVRLREVIARRKNLLERVRQSDERAEAALRDGDEPSARDILMKKQDWTKQLEESRKETDVWLSAVRLAKEKLQRTRAEANDLLTAEGLPPIAEGSEPVIDPEAPRIRIKT